MSTAEQNLPTGTAGSSQRAGTAGSSQRAGTAGSSQRARTAGSAHRAGTAGSAQRSEEYPHEAMLLRADVRRLAIALAPYGILHRETLAQVAGAHQWHEGAFEAALEEAFRRGVIQRLPENFCSDPTRTHPTAPR
jgi:hypothetical protein